MGINISNATSPITRTVSTTAQLHCYNKIQRSVQELIVDVHINSNYPLALSFPFHPTATIQCKFIIAAHVLLF